jgi:hypothetical protein
MSGDLYGIMWRASNKTRTRSNGLAQSLSGAHAPLTEAVHATTLSPELRKKGAGGGRNDHQRDRHGRDSGRGDGVVTS